MHKVTSADIAKIAGVSRSTVSRVVNNYSNVPEETRQRVLAVIEQMHYYPQVSGQILGGMSFKTLGLFFGPAVSLASNTSRIAMGVIQAAARRGYFVMCFMLPDPRNRDDCNRVMRIFMEGRIDGGIFVGMNPEDSLITELEKAGKILGLYDYPLPESGCGSVLAVNYEEKTAESAIDYLYEMGHRDIAVINGDPRKHSSYLRRAGFLRSLEKHGLTLRSEWEAWGSLQMEPGYEAAKIILSDREHLPTAICAGSDTVAFGVYMACKDLGLRIPEDISVIGSEDRAGSSAAIPPLTTFSFDYDSMMQWLLTGIIDKIEDRERAENECHFAGTLVSRASVRRLE